MQRSRMRDVAPTPPPVGAARLAPIMEATAVTNVSVSPSLPAMPQAAWTCNVQMPFFPQQAMPQFSVPSVVDQLCGSGADTSIDATRAALAPCLPISCGVASNSLQEAGMAGPVTPQNRPSASAESPC